LGLTPRPTANSGSAGLNNNGRFWLKKPFRFMIFVIERNLFFLQTDLKILVMKAKKYAAPSLNKAALFPAKRRKDIPLRPGGNDGFLVVYFMAAFYFEAK
jgi:hypothetical protein